MPQWPAIIELGRRLSPAVCILLADDFEPWRSLIRTLLANETNWEIFEATDGVDAVQKTAELSPDIVLVDVSMPHLNGIEAASRMRKLSPESAIIFLSENADEDVRAAALQAGAVAYVLKREAGTKLLPTVQAALRARS